MGKVTALKKKEVEAEVSLDDILSGATTEKKSGSTSKVPVLQIDEDTKKLVKEIREIKEEMDNIEAQFKLKEAELIEKVKPLREKICQQAFTSSIKIPSSDNLSILMSWKHAYSKVKMDMKAALDTMTGGRFSEFFAVKMEITTRSNDENSLKELIGLVGKENFPRFFNVERWIAPTERYTSEFFTAFEPKHRAELSAAVRQYKPAIKA